jgi:hypothetical protein
LIEDELAVSLVEHILKSSFDEGIINRGNWGNRKRPAGIAAQ